MKQTVKILSIIIIVALTLLCGTKVKAAVKPELWLINLPQTLFTTEETKVEGSDDKLTNINVTVTLTRRLDRYHTIR